MDSMTATAPIVTRTLRRARFGSPNVLHGTSIANLAGNILLVVTGGIVRLTGSGLGCPTWPTCSPDSLVPTPALGIHGVIEFGNRTLFGVLAVIALLCFAASIASDHPRRRLLIGLSLAIGLGIPFQGVVGGITVLTHLNPYVVALHLLSSMAIIVLAVLHLRVSFNRAPAVVARGVGRLPLITFVVLGIAVWLGTVVTGSGPHAGDPTSPRTGLNIAMIAHIHADGVYAAVLLTVITMIMLRSKAALLLLAVEVLQGVVGFVQYYTALPSGLVLLHLLGASLAITTGANLLFSYRVARAPD